MSKIRQHDKTKEKQHIGRIQSIHQTNLNDFGYEAEAHGECRCATRVPKVSSQNWTVFQIIWRSFLKINFRLLDKVRLCLFVCFFFTIHFTFFLSYFSQGKWEVNWCNPVFWTPKHRNVLGCTEKKVNGRKGWTDKIGNTNVVRHILANRRWKRQKNAITGAYTSGKLLWASIATKGRNQIIVMY